MLMKRLLSSIITFLFSVGMMIISITLCCNLKITLISHAFDDYEEVTYGGVIYDVYMFDGWATVVGCEPNVKDAVILGKIDGCTVLDIGDSAFSECTSLTSLVIEDGVVVIGNNAFENCTSLVSVSFPNSLNKIKAQAFRGCSKLCDINFSEGIEAIYQDAFYDCAIEELILPDSLSSIDTDAFSSNLIKKINIGANQTKISMLPLENNTCLEEIIVSKNNPVFSSFDGLLLDKNGIEVLMCPLGKTDTCFVPNGVETIGEKAFYKCNKIKNIDLPDTIKRIGKNAFSYCEELSKIKIPDSTISIEKEAFFACRKMKSVSIGESLLSLDSTAFGECISLIDFTVDEGNSKFSDEKGILYDKNKTTLVSYPTAKSEYYQIPNSVVSICENAFHRKTNSTILIPESVTDVDANMIQKDDLGKDRYYYLDDDLIRFYTPLGSAAQKVIGSGYSMINYVLNKDGAVITDCINGTGELEILSEIEGIPVVAIGDGNSLTSTDKLLYTSIVIPEGVTCIGRMAFGNQYSYSSYFSSTMCPNLKKIVLPSTISSIGDFAFDLCSSLKQIEVSEKNNNFVSENGILFDKNKTTLLCYPAAIEDAEYVIPQSVEEIGTDAFCSSRFLEKVTLSRNVTKVGKLAFEKCDNLQTVTIYNKMCDIGIDSSSPGDTFPVDTILCGYNNSTAQTFAEKYNFTFSFLEDVKVEGDINADNQFTISDVVLLQKWLLAVPDTKLVDWEAADLCEDGVLDVFDLCLMKRKMITE